MIKLHEHFKIADPYHDGKLEEYFLLRWKVLREPWGQPKGTERDDLEEKSLHRMILSPGGKVVACGRLQLNDPREAQIRYMAVHPDFTGQGLGKMLMHELDQLAIDAGAVNIVLQARENAVDFYLSCGYTVVMETFLLYNTIQHFLMEKQVGMDS